MLKNNLQYFILIICISFNCFGQDQEAEIFFKNGDSVKGYGMIKMNKIKFKIALEDKFESWDHESISKIEFYDFNKSRIFKYVKLNKHDDPEILEVIVEEEVALYRDSYTQWLDLSINQEQKGLGTNSQIVKDYLKRINDAYPTCVNCDIFNKWKKNTMTFFADCPTLVLKIQTNLFREKHLQEIVEYYLDYCYEE